MRDLLVITGVTLDAPQGITFSGPIGTALETLRDMLAASSSFQAWTGTADADAAKARIHLFVVPEAEIETRPWALISLPPGGFEYRRIAGGAASFMVARGRAWIDFEADVDPADTPQEAEQDFVDNTEAALEDVLALAGVDANLPIETVDRVSGPGRSDHDEDDDYYASRYECPWGIAA